MLQVVHGLIHGVGRKGLHVVHVGRQALVAKEGCPAPLKFGIALGVFILPDLFGQQ